MSLNEAHVSYIVKSLLPMMHVLAINVHYAYSAARCNDLKALAAPKAKIYAMI